MARSRSHSLRPRLAEIAEKIRRLPEIGAVAVCLLFSYLNPEHERRIKEILADLLPDILVIDIRTIGAGGGSIACYWLQVSSQTHR